MFLELAKQSFGEGAARHRSIVPMLRSIVPRFGLPTAVLGCAVLGASLWDWLQTVHATEDGYAWVVVDASDAPAIETAEVWQASANCERPFLIKAALQSKARLKNHYDLAPQDVRAWRSRPTRSQSLQVALDQRDVHGFIKVDQRSLWSTVTAEIERDARLHAQYAEWFATASRLERQANQWEQRLVNVADQRVILGEATRRSFGAYFEPDAEPATAKSSYERQVLFLLGLSGFPSKDEQALKANCINVTAVKKIFRGNHFREVWRWPLDHVVVFSFGLELVLIGLLFVPIALWIGTGDPRVVKHHIRDAANRLSAKVLKFHRSAQVFDVLSSSRAMLAGIRALLRDLMNAYPAGNKIR